MPDMHGLVVERPPMDPPREVEATSPRRDVASEPATPRALWPTFMRRTLCEETLHAGTERTAR